MKPTSHRRLGRLPAGTGLSKRFGRRAALLGLIWPALACGAQAATLSVNVDGVEGGRGNVYVSLCSGGLEPFNCMNGVSEPAAGPTLSVTIPDVEPGVYAVAAYQDLNGNGSLDRSRNGLPLEPYGFSNGAGRFAAPSFERAALRIGGDVRVSVHLASVRARRPEPR